MGDNKEKTIVISGAGLVGSLTAVRMRERGYKVIVVEKRKDPRRPEFQTQGKSINLALSTRGLTALGTEIEKRLREIAIPMQRRIIHDQDGTIRYQKYGTKQEHYLLSVSRSKLNELLIDIAEEKGATFIFGAKTIGCDLMNPTLRITTSAYGNETWQVKQIKGDLLVGADGIFSTVRIQMSKFGIFDFTQKYISHGYLELTMEPTKDGKFAFEETLKKGAGTKGTDELVHGLHIWARKDFMLIALPNIDNTYTVTLFCRMQGKGEEKPGFDQFKTAQEFEDFFVKTFPDAAKAMPNLKQDWENSRPSGLCYVKANPYHFRDKAVLLGDAAHAVVPFYGQGVNAGFASVRIFMELLDKNEQAFDKTLPAFSKNRVQDGQMIAQLAVEHFEDMKYNTTDDAYFQLKRYEKDLTDAGLYESLYIMVSFSNTPYSQAHEKAQAQLSTIQNIIANNRQTFLKAYGDQILSDDQSRKERDFLINCYRQQIQ